MSRRRLSHDDRADQRLNMRLSAEDREKLSDLSDVLGRSVSDTIRYLILVNHYAARDTIAQWKASRRQLPLALKAAASKPTKRGKR